MSDEHDLFGPVSPKFPHPPSVGLTPETLEASVGAADQIEPTAETLRAAVFQYIDWCGEAGATDEEIQIALKMAGNTERPRRWELYLADKIYSDGHRVNGRGRKCAVWYVK
jgi:hypothetical protein